MSRTYANILLHVVWSTRNRAAWITANLEPRLYGYLRNAFENQQAKVMAMNGMPDHVHVLVSIKPTSDFSELMRNVKTASSKWLRANFQEFRDFAWQDGYGAFSVGLSTVKNVQNYIANQKQHHSSQTYQEEFLNFLKAHEIPYDERFVFG